MSLESGRHLKNDILFRGSESIGGASAWEGKILDYINRTYRSIAMGSSEFLPEHVPDWWWMRSVGALILEPLYNTGSVEVTQGSNQVTIIPSPEVDMIGRKFRVDGHPDLFNIVSHGAGGGVLTLDTEYTGPSGPAEPFQIMKTVYSLGQSVAGLVSPMISYRDVDRIVGVTPERMDYLYPLVKLESGPPLAFALEGETLVRFSHGGRTDGMSMRVDYRFKPILEDIEDSVDSIPLIPLQYRHVLADASLVYLMIDKNDNRANTLITSTRAVLTAMFNENKHRAAKIDDSIGWIFPRGGPSSRLGTGPLRTESGLIIG